MCSADFGLPERAGLLDLARTYLEVQARIWPELADTTAVPVADAATIAAMADDFERRLRDQIAEVFEPGATPRPWHALGVAEGSGRACMVTVGLCPERIQHPSVLTPGDARSKVKIVLPSVRHMCRPSTLSLQVFHMFMPSWLFRGAGVALLC